MKAISLWQPWASLVAHGLKRIETRPRYTKYRGPLAIHASKTWTKSLGRMCFSGGFEAPLTRIGLAGITRDLCGLPLGAVVATCVLEDCLHINDEVQRRIKGRELEFGDYTLGRYAWLLSDVKRLETPIEFSGKQGWFEVPDELLAVQAVEPVRVRPSQMALFA